jgi:hypothetical protein
MFGLSPIRLYLYAAAALLLGYLLWHERHLAHALADSKAANKQLAATIKTERENTRKANEAEKNVIAKLDALERDAREHPLPKLRCRAAVVPKAAGTAISGEAAQADDTGADAVDFDPTPELDHFATDAEANVVQCTEAIKYLEGLAR